MGEAPGQVSQHRCTTGKAPGRKEKGGAIETRRRQLPPGISFSQEGLLRKQSGVREWQEEEAAAAAATEPSKGKTKARCLVRARASRGVQARPEDDFDSREPEKVAVVQAGGSYCMDQGERKGGQRRGVAPIW